MIETNVIRFEQGILFYELSTERSSLWTLYILCGLADISIFIQRIKCFQ